MKSKAKIHVVVAVIVSLGVAACAVAPAAPTPLPPTPTPVPPTPTPVPPTPTPSITVDDLIGIWQDESGCYIQLSQDGAYRYAHATLWLETAPVDEGQYRLEGTTLTFSSSNASRECTGQSGSYQVELTSQDQFQLMLLEDPCKLRAGYRPGPWERVEP